MSATICINDGDTHNTPIEAGEVRIPYITEYYRLRQDSGGPGRYRGGLGAELCRRVLAHGFFNSQIERTIYLLGASPGDMRLFRTRSEYGVQMATSKSFPMAR